MQLSHTTDLTDDAAARDDRDSEALLTVRVMLREDLFAERVTEAEHDTISAWIQRRNSPLSARARARQQEKESNGV